MAIKDLGFSFRLASLTPIYAWNGANSDLERMGLAAEQMDPTEPHYGVVRRGELRLFQAVYADRAVSQAASIAITGIPTAPAETSSSTT